MSADYYSNHRLKLRFPWRLYHGPILHALEGALGGTPAGRVLNVGSGPFLELGHLRPSAHRFTLCDIDARAMDEAQRLHGDRIERTDVVQGIALPYEDNSFDLVVSMDVIEHVPETHAWLRELLRVVRPGGHVFLTTPNYGSWSLTWLERTALEAIARAQGFSRRDIHPVKLDRRRLEGILQDIGGTRADIDTISFGWVLTASLEKRS